MTMTLVSNTDSTKTKTIKFLYSYGGKIIPRRTDGKLRYVAGMTRVLSVPRSVTFAELMVKLGELCGSSKSLKCKLPNEDLDVLISITSDDDLRNLISEYDRFSALTNKEEKITAILFPIKTLKKITPVSSAEDLCSSVSIVQSANTTCRHRCDKRMVHTPVYNQRCRGGVSPRNTCYVPNRNYGR